MRKNTSTAHLATLRFIQMGRPGDMEGFSYTAQGDISPDNINNRKTRRMAKRTLRREGKL
ncbi:TPA: hypothetical protein ACIBE2_002250 [Salmonella enterica subsp. diarizonae serovar 61:r:-]